MALSAGSFVIILPLQQSGVTKGPVCREGCYFVLLFHLSASQKYTVPHVTVLQDLLHICEIETITAHPAGVIAGLLHKQSVRPLHIFTGGLKIPELEKLPNPLHASHTKDLLKME